MANRDQILQPWIDDTTQTISALIRWRTWLTMWQSQAAPVDDAEFMDAVQAMKDAGLESWLDQNPLGLDELHEAVTE